MDTTAIVLAGGRGSRMNNRDKAWIDYMGRPLIRWVIEKIEPQVNSIVISRNSTNPAYESLPFQKFADKQLPGDQSSTHEGPLSGIVSCLPAINSAFALVVPCDTPQLPTNLVTELASRLDDHDVVIASDSQRDHYLVFLARTPVLNTIGDHLETGQRSVKSWLETVNYTRCRFTDSTDPFLNINEPGQLGESYGER